MAGYGDRAASILDSKQPSAKSAESAISPPLDGEQSGAISAISAESPLVARRYRLYERLEDGYQKIDLALGEGRDVTPLEDFWLALLNEYEQVCDEILATPATQATLFDAPRRYV